MSLDRFIGIPWVDKGRDFSGLDCWGLVWMANRLERNVELPCYSDRYVTASDRRAIAALIGGELAPWEPVVAGCEVPWDCVMMRDGAAARHIGLVVDRGRMLHVRQGHLSVIESYRTGATMPRIIGFFRYRRAA